MFDLKVQNFKEQLIEIINSCGLPISVINYVLSDVHNLTRQSLEEEIQKQKLEIKQQEVVEINAGEE